MWLALYCSSALSGTLASVLPIFHCSPKHENKMLRLSLFAMPVPPAAAAKLLQLCPTLCDPTDGRQAYKHTYYSGNSFSL